MVHDATAHDTRSTPLLGDDVGFRLLVEAVEDYAIFLLTPDGEVLTWNRGAQRIKGYTADEIVGRHFSAFYVPEERDAGRPMRLLAQAAADGRVEDEGWRVRRDGTRFWADVVVTALFDEQGGLRGFAKITRDLTERRAAEEQGRALLIEQAARARAEDALRTRDRFLSIASHELKTPVATLRLATESLARTARAGRLDRERLSVVLGRIGVAIQRLDALVDELLDVTRLRGEMAELDLRPTDLVAVVRDVVGRFADAPGGDRIELVAPAAARIPGDASLLDQVVTNLLDNALKYSDPPAPVEVEVREAAEGIELRVADRGIGLGEGGAGSIFEAFGRGVNAEHFQGLGLGLYITSQIVAQHHGRIEAHSRGDGAGAVFSVWLPRDAEKSA